MLIHNVGKKFTSRTLRNINLNLQCLFMLEVLYILLVVRNFNCDYNHDEIHSKITEVTRELV
jgi:hypothetical protein